MLRSSGGVDVANPDGSERAPLVRLNVEVSKTLSPADRALVFEIHRRAVAEIRAAVRSKATPENAPTAPPVVPLGERGPTVHKWIVNATGHGGRTRCGYGQHNRLTPAGKLGSSRASVNWADVTCKRCLKNQRGGD